MSSVPILGVRSTMNDNYQLNIRKLFERGCLLQPSSMVVSKLQNGTERITYKTLQHQATKIAAILTNNYNINIGDRIGTFMNTNISHILLLYAIPCMGMIFSPINYRLHKNDLSFIIQHSEHKMLFIDADLIPIFNQIPSHALKKVKYFIICPTETPHNAISTLTNIDSSFQKVINFKDLQNETYISYNWPELDERNGACLLYTSGTTGHPKGSLYSHRSLYIHLLNMAATDSFNCSGIDCLLTMVQLFHVLSTLTPLLAFMLGFKLLIPNRCNDYLELLNFCINEKCTVINGVVIHAQSFYHALISDTSKYNSLKKTLTRVVVGGSAPPSFLIQWFWDQLNCELIQSWGMSETQGISYFSRKISRRSDLLLSETDQLKNMLVPGLPLPSIHGKIVYNVENNDKNMGDLYVRGPIVTGRYYNIERANSFDKNDGSLNTGDIVSFTDRKQLVIHDRSKDMIKSGGEWISSKDMENYVISKFSKVMSKVCVVAAYHEIYEERPVMIVQFHEKNKIVCRKEIINYLKTKYANFQLPDEILFWDEIPLTGTNKISKKDVRLQLKKQKYKLPKIPLRKIINNNSKL